MYRKLSEQHNRSTKIIRYQNCSLHSNIVKPLAHFKALEELYLTFVYTDDKTIVTLFNTLSNLTVLSFSSIQLKNIGFTALINYLKHSKSIKELTLQRALFNIKNINTLVDTIIDGETVEYLNLADNRLNDNSINLQKLLSSISIKNLNLNKNKFTLALPNLETIISKSTVEVLNLSYNEIDDYAFQELTLGLKNNSNLEELYLDNNQIDFSCYGPPYFSSNLNNLRTLSLNNNFNIYCCLSDLFVTLFENDKLEQFYCNDEYYYSFITTSINLTSLKVLHIPNFNFSYLKDYLSFHNLVSLQISICATDMETFLTMLKKWTNLRNLHLNFLYLTNIIYLTNINPYVPQIVAALKNNYTLLKFKYYPLPNIKEIDSLIKRNRCLLNLQYQCALCIKNNDLHSYTKRFLPKAIYNDCFDETVQFL